MINRIRQIARRSLTLRTHRIYELPILMLMPHSRCNCRCVMCDIWKANQHKQELRMEDFAKHLPALRKLRVQQVVFSGGEALMHSNLWTFCEVLRSLGIKITLLSTGLLLEKNAARIIRWCDEVIISLDGSEGVHNRIRNIPDAYRKLKTGIAALRKIEPAYRITGRCVLQRLNYADFPFIIAAARDLQLDQISFLAADVSSTAFNRPKPLPQERVAEIALTAEEVNVFQDTMEAAILENQAAFAEKFIAESPQKLRRIVQYYAALCGEAALPATRCNAPWVSAVIESNGDVLPCFFHPRIGNIYQDELPDILNSPAARRFRRELDVSRHPICQKCVCSLHLRPADQIATA